MGGSNIGYRKLSELVRRLTGYDGSSETVDQVLVSISYAIEGRLVDARWHARAAFRAVKREMLLR